jgi:hypothetical protein
MDGSGENTYMHLIYIHQHFCTNEGSSGTRSLDVSRHLVEMGHKVTMICGRADNSGLPEMPWYRLFQRIRIDNFDVIACNVRYANEMGSIARTAAYVYFSLLACLAGLFVRKADLVFATSTPLSVAIPGIFLRRMKRVPMVFEVRAFLSV